MAEPESSSEINVAKLIALPGVITLAVTILRTLGELQHWSAHWFNPAPGGAWAIVGIVWLVPLFGIYFALKLQSHGHAPEHMSRPLLLAAAGLLIFACGFFLFQAVIRNLSGLVIMWTLAAAAGLIQALGWRGLFRTLLAYGYAARIPVAVIMFVATMRGWESHYTALAFPTSEMKPLMQYVMFGFIPQLIWWVSFTVVVGTLFGTAAAVLLRQRKPQAQAVS